MVELPDSFWNTVRRCLALRTLGVLGSSLALGCGARTALSDDVGACSNCAGSSTVQAGSGSSADAAAQNECIPAWQRCSKSAECCTGMCYNTVCMKCQVTGESCASDGECCTGICDLKKSMCLCGIKMCRTDADCCRTKCLEGAECAIH